MFLQLSLFCLLAIVAADPVTSLKDTGSPNVDYSQGGTDESIENAPHQVSLHRNGLYRCGGSIVGLNWVVTTASCVDDKNIVWTVRDGSKLHSSGGNSHDVLKVVLHPKYQWPKDEVPINNVALVKVNPAFDVTGIPKVIALSTKKSSSGDLVNITGWGASSENGTLHDNLQLVNVPVILDSQCDTVYTNIITLPPQKICTLDSSGKRYICTGDEGSPVTRDNELAGIVSWHYGCGRSYPDIHTDIYDVKDWIKEILRDSHY